MDLVIKEYFNRYRKDGKLPPLIDGKVKGKLAAISLNLKFEVPDIDLKITGKLDDCLQLPDGSLIPLDHKTRASLPGDTSYSARYYQTQMDTYTLLLQKTGHKTTDEACIIYYSPATGELHKGVPFEVEVHQLKTRPERAFELYQQAKRCLEGALPDFNGSCEFCKWSREVANQ
ncbi:MAG: PD-(D/E)XK nuclease family protein [candidate division Zixibacteria bacterium]|nr:PD-(D/E)XK nuclease family protein [candidate division Zixibacteria bacterium]